MFDLIHRPDSGLHQACFNLHKLQLENKSRLNYNTSIGTLNLAVNLATLKHEAGEQRANELIKQELSILLKQTQPCNKMRLDGMPKILKNYMKHVLYMLSIHMMWFVMGMGY